MKKQVSFSRQWLMAGAILFLSAACQPKAPESSSNQAAKPMTPAAAEMGSSCKPASQDCVKECPKKECPCPTECKKECPCPTECKKECPCPTECPKKECPCPCPTEKGTCEVELKQEPESAVAQVEVTSEAKAEPAISSTTVSVVETPAS